MKSPLHGSAVKKTLALRLTPEKWKGCNLLVIIALCCF
jgi:hypothetical protein